MEEACSGSESVLQAEDATWWSIRILSKQFDYCNGDGRSQGGDDILVMVNKVCRQEASQVQQKVVQRSSTDADTGTMMTFSSWLVHMFLVSAI